MAIYHLSIKIITRGEGKSAVAAAAYRAGETIKNEYDGITHDYTRKKGIVHTEILLPGHAPRGYSDRSVLWNAVEKSERYKTAQLAREIEIVLLMELTREQNIALSRRYAKDIFINAGMCADVCVHDKGDGNPHAQIILTMRPITLDGKWGQKSHTVHGRKVPAVDWNDRNKVEDWRKAWAAYCNTALRINECGVAVDHRSYKRQGVEQIPTVHLGVAATRMERHGVRTDLGDKNREIEITNREIRMLRARVIRLEKWIAEEPANVSQPSLADVISEILSRQGQSVLSRLKAGAEVFNFLQENHITDMTDLEEKVESMYGNIQKLRDDLTPMERRLKTLDEHIRQAGIYLQYKGKVLTESEAILFAATKKYLIGVLNGRTDVPLKKWKAERDAKTAERETLYAKYSALKMETQKVERIRKSVHEIMRAETRQSQTQKIIR